MSSIGLLSVAVSSAAPRLSPLRCRASDCANFSLQLETSNVSCARVGDQRCCGSTVDVQCAQETNATCCAATRIDVSGDQDSLTPFSWTLRCSCIAKSRFQKSAKYWICLSHSWPAACWNTQPGRQQHDPYRRDTIAALMSFF